MKVEEIIQAIYDGTFEESEGIEFMFFAQRAKGDDDASIDGKYEGSGNRLSAMLACLMLKDPNFRKMVLCALDKIANFAVVTNNIDTIDDEPSEETNKL